MTTGYYVTLQRKTRDGIRTAWLLGPFSDHDAAKAAVRETADKATEIDPRCHWDAHGTSSITRDSGEPLPAGKLNALLPHLMH